MCGSPAGSKQHGPLPGREKWTAKALGDLQESGSSEEVHDESACPLALHASLSGNVAGLQHSTVGTGHCGHWAVKGRASRMFVLMLTVSYPILSLNHSDLWYTFCTACCHVKTNLSRGVECLCKEVGQKSFKLHHANTTGVEWLCKRPARSSNRVVGCKLLTIKTLFSL
jgi:hypothetical protein